MSRKPKRNEWTHEGGVSFDSSSSVDAKPRGPRVTQERDERFRRGRLKMHDGKNKRLIAKKMQNKISFAESIPVEDGTEDDAGEDEARVTKATPRERKRSSLSVMQRFQKMLKSNFSQQRATRDEEGEDDEKDVEEAMDTLENADDDESDDQDTNNQDIGTSAGFVSNGRDGVVEVEEELGEAADEEADVNVGDDQEEEKVAGSSFDWFFSTSNTNLAPNSKPKLQLLSETAKFSLYGWLNEEANFQAKRIEVLGDIPGLPKLWKSRASETLESMASLLLPQLSSYSDAFIDGRDHRCDKELLTPIILHTCLHLLKSRTSVLKHNTKLKQKLLGQQAAAAATELKQGKEKKGRHTKNEPVYASTKGMDTTDSSYQDQGFTRPRVLILCPFRGVALQCLETMLQIFGENTSVANLEKFREEYGTNEIFDDDDVGDDNDEISSGTRVNRTQIKRTKQHVDSNKDDWKADFQQNVDDNFKIGVQINPGHGKGSGVDKGVYVRLYSDFFISDVIIASPLALRLLLENGDKKSADFLSSIELVVLHQADIVYMQNWDHLEYVMRHVNKLPATNNDIDFSRVRPYFLDETGSKHRQLIMTSHFNEPGIYASFRQLGQSQAGTLRLYKNWKEGVISQVMRKINQVFQRVECQDFHAQEEERFAYFKNSVLGPLLRTNQKRTIIVTPSYISYVRIRNELLRQDASAVFICEYSRESEISRGRSRFFHGSKDILLYSGRFHYFRRFQIRGANHIIFYSVPEYPHFYPELVNMVTEGDQASTESSSALLLFTRFEQMALERLVGKKRTNHLVTSDKPTFMFK